MKQYIEKIYQRLQNKYYRYRGIHIDCSTTIREFVYIDKPNHVYIGKHSSVNPFCKLQIGDTEDADIIIGDNVAIAANCKISCITHDVGDSNRRTGKHIYKNVEICDGCWIGLNVTIISGVTIGKGCVIGAGAVVIHDTEPNCLYVGVPARKIRSLN